MTITICVSIEQSAGRQTLSGSIRKAHQRSSTDRVSTIQLRMFAIARNLTRANKSWLAAVRNNSRSNISAVENFTTDICLPAGTYRLVFIASEVANVIKSTAVLTKVYLSDSPCTYTALTGNRRLYVFSL